ncbi:MAG: zinc-ribbon domain-containing protein [Hyphomicrobiales bacterium]
MIITCPNCAMHYDVPKAFLPPEGEEIECPGCKTAWQYKQNQALQIAATSPQRRLPPPAPLKSPRTDSERASKFTRTETKEKEPVPEIDVKAEAKRLMLKAQRARRRFESEQQQRAATFRGWCAYAACMTGLVVAAVMFPNHVTRALPGSIELYEKVGLDAGHSGLGLEKITTTSVLNGGTLIITVKGHVVNNTTFMRNIPPIELSLKRPDGTAVHAWKVKAEKKDLPAKGSFSFTTRLAAPPQTDGKVEIRFAARDEIS